MKYQNKKTGVVAELVRENKKFKTVTLRDEAGNEKDYSQSTISRWWTKLDGDSTDDQIEDKDPVKEVAAQLVAMATPEPEEAEEEIADEKTTDPEPAKAEDKPKRRRSTKSDKKTTIPLEERAGKVSDYLTDLGYSAVTVNKVIKAKKEGSRNLHIYIGRDKFVLYFSKNNVPEGKVADRIANCPLSHRFDIAYDSLESIKEFM